MSKRIQTSIVTKARRTELVDAQEVVKFVNKQTTDLFGPKCKELGKIFELIEKSVLSITLEDEQSNRILAQACFYDYPNTIATQPKSWEQWLEKNYEPSKITSFNSLYLTFFVAQPEFSMGCAEEIIKSAFKAVPECHYILLCAPMSVVPEASLSALFTEMKRLTDNDGKPVGINHDTAVFCANRDKFVPVLFVREANVRDNDDLSPLFNSYTNLLKATYGDFYVAEMIEAQNENNKCLTAEAKGFGIGFMAITNDVNTRILNDCFELQPFHGLCEPHVEDILEPVKEEEPDDDDNDVIVSSEKTSKSQVDSKAQLNSKISFEEPEIRHKLSESGLNIQSGELEIDDGENSHNASKNKSQLSDYSAPSKSGVSEKRIAFCPQYMGKSKAFAIQLFCIEEKYESRSLDFLPRAFEMFPDKDFCIITLPPNVPEFALIQNFFRVTPKVTNKLNQELYVFHRSGLAKNFIVREANKTSDYLAVEKLVGNIHSKAQILQDFNSFLRSRKDSNGVDIQAYIAEVLGRVVGFAIIRSEEDVEYLRSNFNIDDFIYYTHHRREEHGHINHFSLIPVFSFLTKFFIKEILRSSSKTCLYYPIYPEYASKNLLESYSLISSLNFMVPVKKRSQISYDEQKLGQNMPSTHVTSHRYNFGVPCALNHINRKLLLEPKIAINLRIVIIGASELAISFLETLAFSPHLRFNNITLVSSNGLPGMLPPDELRDGMRAQSMNYDQKDHAYMSLRSWVNVVIGKMTHIDRRQKNIYINEHTVLPYDHLILCTGEQYYPVAPLQARVYNSYSRQEVKPHISRPFFGIPPLNMFVINNEYESESVLAYIAKNKLIESNENIIIYGMDLNVLAVLQTLKNLEIDMSRVHVFCDKNANNQYAINNTYVSSKIHESLRELKVNIHKQYHFDDWNNGTWNSGLPIKQVTFIKNSENSSLDDGTPRVLQLECCLFLCYYRKDVDYTAYMATNSSNLVYDGRLVIDNNFHTNDSCIRSAGKMTKYKRSYYVENWTHGCFNQKEIGVDLAQNILKLLDPTIVSDEKDDEVSESAKLAANEPSEKCLITLYKKPLVTYAILPGDYYYLNVTKPGLFVPFDEEKNEGLELITDTESGYFRLHLNKHNVVQTITCLSKKPFSASNIVKLYGLHEQFLNKLVLKYERKSIKDFYDFFSDNWCNALYHDRFSDLCKEIRELSTNPTNGIKSVNDLLRDQVDKDLILTSEQRKTIGEYFVQSQTKSLIEKRLLNYINYNSNHLPMYAKPDMI